MRSPRIDFYRDTAKQWRWRFQSNGHVLANSGQGYSRRIDCIKAAEKVVDSMPYGVAWLRKDQRMAYGQIIRKNGEVVEVWCWS